MKNVNLNEFEEKNKKYINNFYFSSQEKDVAVCIFENLIVSTVRNVKGDIYRPKIET